MLDLIPQTEEAESVLLAWMTLTKCRPDIDFFNFLIKRKVKRSEFTAAQNVLALVRQYKLAPNIMTFNCLAMTCKNPEYCRWIIGRFKGLSVGAVL